MKLNTVVCATTCDKKYGTSLKVSVLSGLFDMIEVLGFKQASVSRCFTQTIYACLLAKHSLHLTGATNFLPINTRAMQIYVGNIKYYANYFIGLFHIKV